MDCDDAEEARDLLRHKNSNVTRAIYRAHFGDRRREQLRARIDVAVDGCELACLARAATRGPQLGVGRAHGRVAGAVRAPAHPDGP